MTLDCQRYGLEHVIRPENHNIEHMGVFRKVTIRIYKCFLHKNVSAELKRSPVIQNLMNDKNAPAKAQNRFFQVRQRETSEDRLHLVRKYCYSQKKVKCMLKIDNNIQGVGNRACH